MNLPVDLSAPLPTLILDSSQELDGVERRLHSDSQIVAALREEERYVRGKNERAVLPENGSVPTFEWAGALKDLKEQFTSVELQHDATKRRADER